MAARIEGPRRRTERVRRGEGPVLELGRRERRAAWLLVDLSLSLSTFSVSIEWVF